MRVLHLIDAPAPGEPWTPGRAGEAELAACALLVRLTPELEHTVCLIGGSGLERTAAALGVRTTDRIAPPLGRAALAKSGLRRLVGDRGVPAVVHAWSEATAQLALAALPAAVGVAEFRAGSPTALRRVGGPRRVGRPGSKVRIGGPSSPELLLFLNNEWPERGLPGSDLARLVAPPAAVLSLRPEERAVARGRLGLSDEDVLLAPIGLPGQVDAVRFAFLLGLLAQAERPVVGLLRRDAGQLARGLRFARRLPSRARLLLAERPMAALLPLCDLGVWDGGGFGPVSARPFERHSGTVPIALAHGAGVPVVSPEGAAPAALYAAAHGACVGHSAAIPELARKLIPLIAEADRRAAAGAAAATVIGRERPDLAFVAGCLAVYRELGAVASRAGSAEPAARASAEQGAAI